MKLIGFISFLTVCFAMGFATLSAGVTSVPNSPGMTVNGAAVPNGVPNVAVTSSTTVSAQQPITTNVVVPYPQGSVTKRKK